MVGSSYFATGGGDDSQLVPTISNNSLQSHEEYLKSRKSLERQRKSSEVDRVPECATSTDTSLMTKSSTFSENLSTDHSSVDLLRHTFAPTVHTSRSCTANVGMTSRLVPERAQRRETGGMRVGVRTAATDDSAALAQGETTTTGPANHAERHRTR